MVEDEDVQPRVLARVVVAAGAPVLPLPHLEARVTCHKLSQVVTSCHVSRYLDAAPLLPHGLGVVEAPAALPVRLQREVAVLAWITRTLLFIFIASLEPVSAFYSGDSSDMSGTTLLRMMGGGAQCDN